MLKQVSQSLLEQSGLDIAQLPSIFGLFSQREIDFADLFFQNSMDENWSLEDGIIR